jgi:Cu(I)/Ag(I) efflux system membrane protein CusA/SilA
MAIGGMPMTTTVEGRERYQVRIRYPRELRNTPDEMAQIVVSAPNGNQLTLGDVVEFTYHKGPMSIKSENTFLVGYVFFDKASTIAEITAVNDAKNAILNAINSGSLEVPQGLSYEFAGNYQNQLRAEQRLSLIIPIVLAIIFLILYFQFRSVAISLMVFLSIALAFSGGFILMQAYANESFFNLNWFGENLRDIFQIRAINLSVAVWVGFIALFGIATDDAVLMATYLKQSFQKHTPQSIDELKEIVILGARRRIKPAVMTSATTIIALLPVLTSTGKGSEIMQPMAIPAFGGMIMASVTYFLLPSLYFLYQKRKLNLKMKHP